MCMERGAEGENKVQGTTTGLVGNLFGRYRQAQLQVGCVWDSVLAWEWGWGRGESCLGLAAHWS